MHCNAISLFLKLLVEFSKFCAIMLRLSIEKKFHSSTEKLAFAVNFYLVKEIIE